MKDGRKPLADARSHLSSRKPLGIGALLVNELFVQPGKPPEVLQLQKEVVVMSRWWLRWT
jgi:hypothetical protein